MPVHDDLLTVIVHGPASRGALTMTLAVSEREHVSEMLRPVAEELQITEPFALAGRVVWILATADGAQYVEGPFRSNVTVGSLTSGARSIELYLDEAPLCMHGSPGVRGRGHLCGWC